MAKFQIWRLVYGAVPILLLTGCIGSAERFDLVAKASGPASGGLTPEGTTSIVETSVEAPELFRVTDTGVWDGRPTQGGVWVAHAGAGDPGRVLIRHGESGRFVIGSLFRRERDFPGPKFQLSAEAATALGLAAGEPAMLEVTALRRDEAEAPWTSGPDAPPLAEPPELSTAASPPPPAVSAAPAPEAAPKASRLAQPYLQIGIFSVERNADRAVSQLTGAGLKAARLTTTIGGKRYWRVLVGPAETAAERARGLTKVKALGYTDAYAVQR